MTVHSGVHHRLAERLAREIEGEVLFDRFSRGRYATDASIYQIEPVGVVVPKRQSDVAAALALAREEGVSVLPRRRRHIAVGPDCRSITRHRHHEVPQPHRRN